MNIDQKTDEMIVLKQRLKDTWTSGDFGQIAKSYETGAAQFISRLELSPNQKVLDVACGTGNLAFAARKFGCTVEGVDIAPNLIEQAKSRSARENSQITFVEGDAEALPYADSSFDVVVTMFGAMFAPRPDIVASELARVSKSGGKIAMANWTPTGFVGEMFKIIGALVPPPSLMPSPLQWGQEDAVRARFGDKVREVRTQKRMIELAFDLPPDQVVSFWRQYYGPTQRAFNALASESDKQNTLHEQLTALWLKSSSVKAGKTSVESEYLEVIVIK